MAAQGENPNPSASVEEAKKDILARGYIQTTGGYMGIMYTGFRIVGFRGAK